MAEIDLTKISQLPEAESIDGLLSLGVDGSEKSVKVPITMLKGNKGDQGEPGEVSAAELTEAIESVTGNSDKTIEQLDEIKENIFIPADCINKSQPNDVLQLGYVNSAVKALYVPSLTLTSTQRVVITYLNKSGSDFQLGLYIYDSSTTTSVLLADTTGLTYKFDEVVPVYNNSTDKTIVAYAYVSLADWKGVVANSGQGHARMPFLLSACFNSAQLLIKSYLLQNQINVLSTTTETLKTSKADIFVPADCIRKDNSTDVDNLAHANAAIKALYVLSKPTGTKRVVINYLNKSGSKYQLGLTLFDSSDNTSIVLADTTGLTYDFDQVVPIYDTSAKANIVAYTYVSLADWKGAVTNVGQGLSRLPYLLAACYDPNSQIRIISYLYNIRLINLEQSSILIWGDSITWGSASSANNNCYTAILRSLLATNGYKDGVINCGVGGENFQNILVRQGAFGFYLADDITLPANTNEKVEIQRVVNYVNNHKFKNTYYGDDSYFALLLQGETGRDNLGDEYKTVNPILVNGIECIMTLEGTQQDCIIYLSPKATQSSTMLIKSGTFLYPRGNRFKQTASVFAIGTNDGFTVTNEGVVDVQVSIDQYIEMTDLAIEKASVGSNYVVCSPYGGTALTKMGMSGLQQLESALTKRYGNRYFNWRKYLVENGLSDAGITPTEADNTAISEGKVPPSLLSDGLHPNDAGHLVLGTKLYKVLKSIGALHK